MPCLNSLWVSSFLISCVSDASRALPEFPDIDLQGKSLPEGIELEHIKSFQLLYREHCEVTERTPVSWLPPIQYLWDVPSHPAVRALMYAMFPTCVLSGHTGRYGQPAVHSGRDTVEDILEVQPESGWRCHAGCVSGGVLANFQKQFSVLFNTSKISWTSSTVSQTNRACLNSHDESEKRLPKSCLVLLCKYEPVLRWSRDCDNSLYQGLVEILIPDVLRPIPSKALQ